jgi:serine/threonine-protein kinase
MSVAARVRIVAEVLAGLHHAHELGGLGVVHRDVSPRNVFLTVDGEVKLLDFGVAKCADRAQQTKHGVLKGSVAYMTPDHVSGATIDRRADVFAAGVLLRELLTGVRLWGDLPDVQILRRLIAREIPPFPPSPVPADLRAICERAMARDRADRYPTADAMRDALERWLGDNAPKACLAPLGASIARALARRAEETVELSSSALVTDVTLAPPPRRTVFAMAAAGVLGLAALVGGATMLLHDAVVVETADVAPAAVTAELPVKAVAPNVAEPTVPSDETAAIPVLPPNPYEPDSI